MHFRVAHTTRYIYNQPVFLEPHTLRLRPRSGPAQRLARFDLRIEPKPALVAEGIDQEGDPVSYAWFEGTTDSLLVHTEFEAETLRTNAFDYLLLEKRQGRLPLRYGREEKSRLISFLRRHSEQDSATAHFASAIAEEAQNDTLRFLALLTERIYRDWQVEVRHAGDPHPPHHTFRNRQGACRDVAVLFMECCRLQGIAARFVSGYQEGDAEADERYMHAWAEVFLPGGGWRGYDPTHGLAVADQHIAVAAAADPKSAAPMEGAIRGTGAVARMEAEIKVETSGDR